MRLGGSLRFWAGGNYKNYKYNKYIKEIGLGGPEPPPWFSPTTKCLSFILKCEKMREFKMGREPQCPWCGGHSTSINACRVWGKWTEFRSPKGSFTHIYI